MVPALLTAVLVLVWVIQSDFVPAGPGAADPGFGAGSDWDIQWASAEAGRSASAAGELSHWDPFPDYGAPVLAHPEAFVAHPAYLLGALHGVPRGLQWLYATSVLALILGFAWLAVELELPWYLALPAAAGVLASFEWEQRLYSGHLMFLGTVWWPAALAAVVRALRAPAPVLWSAVAGGSVAIGSLGGGHYPLLFAAWLLGLAAWVGVVGPRWSLGLLALGVLGLVPWGPQELRWAASAAAALVLVAGVWTSPRRRRLGSMIGGLGLGVVAIAGFRLVPGLLLGRAAGRIRFDSVGRTYDSVPLAEVFRFSGDFEGTLHLASPVLGLGLLVAALALGLRTPRSRLLVVPVLVLTLAAWSAGRPLTTWPLLHLGPGMTGVNYPIRLQWVFLYLAPLAAAWLGWELLERFEHRRTPVAMGLSVVVAVLLLWAAPVEDRVPDGRTVAPVAPALVTGLLFEQADQDLLAAAGRDGKIRVGQASALGFDDPGPPPSLDGVSIQRASVSVRGAVGDEVVVPQRHLTGWTCQGADLAGPDPNRFLALTLTETHAMCRFRSPGLLLGFLLQLTALLALGWLWRARPTSGPAAGSPEVP